MKEIILASNSPRRKALLEKYNIPFFVVSPNIQERHQTIMSPQELAMALAFEKAHDVSLNYSDRTILAADTIVAFEERILGKPSNPEEAEEYLRLLAGNQHRVITGFAVINLRSGYKRIDYVESFVHFRNLTDKEISEYVKSEEPYDKAGGYAIQGMASVFVERYDGDYENIVGLPVQKVLPFLNEAGGI